MATKEYIFVQAWGKGNVRNAALIEVEFIDANGKTIKKESRYGVLESQDVSILKYLASREDFYDPFVIRLSPEVQKVVANIYDYGVRLPNYTTHIEAEVSNAYTLYLNKDTGNIRDIAVDYSESVELEYEHEFNVGDKRIRRMIFKAKQPGYIEIHDPNYMYLRVTHAKGKILAKIKDLGNKTIGYPFAIALETMDLLYGEPLIFFLPFAELSIKDIDFDYPAATDIYTMKIWLGGEAEVLIEKLLP